MLGSTTANLKKKIQTILDKRARLALWGTWKTGKLSNFKIREVMGWLSVNNYIQLYDAVIIHKIIRTGELIYLYNQIMRTAPTCYDAGHKLLLLSKCYLKPMSKTTFIPKAISTWNLFPRNLTFIVSLPVFKKWARLYLQAGWNPDKFFLHITHTKAWW